MATQMEKPGTKKAKKRTAAQRLQKLEQRLDQTENGFEQYRSLVDQKLKALGEILGSIWKNQAELAKSETKLDEQFAVLARIAITQINDLTVRVESDELITYEGVNAMFLEWEQFKNRSDFREHMKAWFMGEDLSSLPEPPKQEEAPEAPTAEGGEEPQEFGGDYGSERQSSGDGDPPVEQGGSEASEDGSQDPVPEGQDDDEAAREAPALP